MATLQSTTIDDTGFIQLPPGTTAQRPASPQAGMARYNTTIGRAEIYNGTAWVEMTPTGQVTDGLVLWLDASQTGGRTGNTWNDLSGVIGNVNIQNRSTDWTFQTEPASGQLCVFNDTDRASGANPGINIPVNNGFNKLEGTFEMWLRPTSHNGGPGWFVNSDGSDHTNASNWLWIGPWSGSTIFYFRIGNPSTCCNDLNLSSFDTNWYPLNVWHHWTITWNVSSRKSSLYRNGILVSRRTDIPSDVPNTNPTNTGQMFNGHNRTGAGENMQFRGYCNLYKIYNRELQGLEISRNFEATRGRFGV